MNSGNAAVPYRGNKPHGAAVLGEGPCCEDMACPVRELWPYPGETDEQFKARLRAKYNRSAMAQEAQTNGD